jgi:hypothetical protein
MCHVVWCATNPPTWVDPEDGDIVPSLTLQPKLQPSITISKFSPLFDIGVSDKWLEQSFGD